MLTAARYFAVDPTATKLSVDSPACQAGAMAAPKDITTATAFLQRVDSGVRPTEWLAPATLTPQELGVDEGGDVGVPVRMFSHEAAVVYLVDQGDHYEWVDEQDIDRAGITADHLHQIGIANLCRLVSQLRLEDRKGVLTFQGLGLFEASMVLCTPLWESDEFQSRFGPMGPIATMPRRDTLAVGVRGDDNALARIGRAPDAVWAAADPELRLCRDLYAMTTEYTWVPYEAATG